MIEGEEVPDRKFIVFTYGSSDNPYGKGLGQKLWWPVWFKKHGIKYWVVFAEKFGSPTTQGKYPPGTPKEQQDDLLEMLEAIQQESGIIYPENMDVSLIEASRKASTDTYEQLCQFMDMQISKAVLGQTATTEGTPGKLGSEAAREEVRQDILKADADVLCELLNNTLIPWIVDYNFPDVHDYPEIWIHTEPEEDLQPLAERDKIIVKEIGLPVGQQYFYDTYNIPKPEEGEETVSAPATPALPDFAEGVRVESGQVDGQDKIDRMVAQTSKDAAPFFKDMWRHIESAAEGANTLGELMGLVPNLYEMLPAGEFVEHMARALMKADDTGTITATFVIAPQSFQEAQWGPGLPFEDALAYFRDRAFTISGITRAELLSEVKAELTRAMEEGLSLADFRKALPEIFERHGYAPLNPWRIETIYRTNLQNAYQGGRLRQMTEPAVVQARPYWRYVAVRDMSTRPEHAAMHGKIFRSDHSFWEKWYPPNGFNCRCTVQTVSVREMDRNNWSEEAEDPTGKLFEPVDIETGRRLPARPLMPDRGWDHMPGRQDLKGLLAEKLAGLQS
jgi:SPP1 gp7 family putative phage head morphogenesis protein